MSDLSISSKGMDLNTIQSCEFEKDDDKNFHIQFINSAANMRARNYRVAECNFHKTKMIAGKIIPAIATTTAMITGCVTTEIYKFVQGEENIEKYKNAFINLATPSWLFSEPDAAKLIKSKEYDPIAMGPVTCVPDPQTIYSKITVDAGSMTVGQL